jgi:quercetin dioxygenase-like cupin family protein
MTCLPRETRPTPVVVTVVLLWLMAAPVAMAQVPTDSARLHWLVPPLLPPGARLAVLSGDPTAPVKTTMLVSMPNHYRLPPHYHPGYEHVQVRAGTLLAGMGDKVDPKRTHALAVGDSATAPGGVHHFSIAQGETLLEVTFEGPYTITYIRAEDAPRARLFPYGY